MATTEIELSPTIQTFYLAQAAHEHMGQVKKSVAAYQRKTKALDATAYHTLLTDLREAKVGLDQALDNWERIVDIITGSPELQAPKEGN
jgi:hypothetical protein